MNDIDFKLLPEIKPSEIESFLQNYLIIKPAFETEYKRISFDQIRKMSQFDRI